jgi:hypothetical protein
MDRGGAAFFAEFLWLFLCLIAVFYIYAAVCVMKIAEKTNTPDAWWAWVPILNVVLLIKIAGKPLWWILLLIIPLVNLIILILVWIAVCEARQKSPALVIGLLLPVVNLVVLGYLAFSD